MKIFLMKCVVAIARAVYKLFAPVKLQDKVVILSRQSDEPSIDICLLRDECSRRNIKNVVLTRKLRKSISGALSYGIHMMQQMYHIASSKVVVTDGYCILVSILDKKEGQKVIQTWHALGVIKKFGYQTLDMPDGSSSAVAEVMRLHRNYDYVIAGSEATGKTYCKTFNVGEETIRYIGMPRIDYLLKEPVPEKLYEDYPQVRNKPAVLFAPTFRRNVSLDISAFAECFDFEKYDLIIKTHVLDNTDFSWMEEKGAIVDKRYSVFDWMKVADKVITDYSGIAFEAAAVEKEIYIYLVDWEEYIDKVGLNMDFSEEAISDYVYYDERTLCEGLEQEYDRSKMLEFRNKYISVDTTYCTGDLVDFIEEQF